EALRQVRAWAARLDQAGAFGEPEALILRIAYGEYLAQLAGGIAMAQSEIVRPQDLGLGDADLAGLHSGAAAAFAGGLPEARARLASLLVSEDETTLFGQLG